MKVVMDIPDWVADRLREKWQDFERASFETIVVEAYRIESLSFNEVAEVLDLNIYDCEQLLAARNCTTGW